MKNRWWWLLGCAILIGVVYCIMFPEYCGVGGTCASVTATADTLVPPHTYAPDGLSLISNPNMDKKCTGGGTICTATSKDHHCPWPSTSSWCKDTYSDPTPPPDGPGGTGVCACKCLNNPPL